MQKSQNLLIAQALLPRRDCAFVSQRHTIQSLIKPTLSMISEFDIRRAANLLQQLVEKVG